LSALRESPRLRDECYGLIAYEESVHEEEVEAVHEESVHEEEVEAVGAAPPGSATESTTGKENED